MIDVNPEPMAVRVSALYIDPRGPYPRIPGVDCWDQARDARNYRGPWPVVAHPPCGPWGRLRHLYTGNDKFLALDAISQVQRYGGILEHPAGSKLWDAMPIPKPGIDAFADFTIEVDQCAWGHVARKKTWLYFSGIARDLVRASIRTGGTPTHWISGGRNCKTGGSVPPGIKVCSAQQRRRTPMAFAEWLVSLAERAGRNGQTFSKEAHTHDRRQAAADGRR